MSRNLAVRNLIGNSFIFLKDNIITLSLVGFLIYFLPRAIIEYNNFIPDINASISPAEVISAVLSLAVITIVSSILTTTVTYAIKIGRRSVSAREVFRGSIRYYLKTIALTGLIFIGLIFIFSISAIPFILISGLFNFSEIVSSVIIFVIAGIITLYFFINIIFANYILVHENKGIIQSIKSSFYLVRKRWFNVFSVLFLIILLMFIFNLLVQIILSFLVFFGLSNSLFPLIVTYLSLMYFYILAFILITNYYLALKR